MPTRFAEVVPVCAERIAGRLSISWLAPLPRSPVCKSVPATTRDAALVPCDFPLMSPYSPPPPHLSETMPPSLVATCPIARSPSEDYRTRSTIPGEGPRHRRAARRPTPCPEPRTPDPQGSADECPRFCPSLAAAHRRRSAWRQNQGTGSGARRPTNAGGNGEYLRGLMAEMPRAWGYKRGNTPCCSLFLVYFLNFEIESNTQNLCGEDYRTPVFDSPQSHQSRVKFIYEYIREIRRCRETLISKGIEGIDVAKSSGQTPHYLGSNPPVTRVNPPTCGTARAS